MQSKAKTVAEYLTELPEDRREAISAVRKVIRKNLDKDFEEVMQYGMIGYVVPHRIYPDGYHCNPKDPLPFACLASQKNYMSIYLMAVYGHDEDWFRKEWAKSGKKLDMGKSCVRFKKLDDLALDVIGKAIGRVTVKQYVEHYESVIKGTRKKSDSTTKKSASKSAAPKKSATTRKSAQKKKPS